MKTIKLTTLLILFTVLGLSAQNRGINYKALLSNNAGVPLANQAVTAQFTIYEGSGATNQVYQETHNTSTDANGIVIVNIGEGAVISGDFNAIDWATDNHFIKTEIDSGNGLIDLGTTEFKTVPYALYAENSGNTGPFSESAFNRNTATNTNADFVVGSSSTEDENNINTDSRLMFDKSKVAFRAGSVDGTQWNDSNRGLYSFAGGRNTTANGVGSTAFGQNTQASGSYSTALGNGNVASGTSAVATGIGTTASGPGQLVAGQYNSEDINASLIIGNGTNDTQHQNAFILKNDGSMIVGASQYANDFSTSYDNTRMFFDKNKGAFRAGTTIGGLANNSYWDDENLGENSVAFGINSIASGDMSSAFGNSTIASGVAATVVGTYNIADDNALFIVGNGSSNPFFPSIIRNNAFTVSNNGNVNINNLAGTGTRVVKVDEDGNLTASTTLDEKVFSINPSQFTTSNSQQTITKNLDLVRPLSNMVNQSFTVSINIPDGATITRMRAFYNDNSSSSNLIFSLIKVFSLTNNDITFLGTAASSGASGAIKEINIQNLTEIVNNANNSYYVTIRPELGGDWDVPNMYVKSIKIYYVSN